MRPSHRLLLLGAPLLLAGCASMRLPPPDPALNPSTVTVPESFALAPDVVAQDRSSLENLLPLTDPVFAQLRKMASDGSPTLAAAIARIDLARSGAARADANRKPNIGADANISGSRQNTGSFGGGLPPGISIVRYRTSFGGNITASWDPDIFGQLRANQRASAIRIDAATADAAAIRQTLIASVAANVIDWRTMMARESTLQSDITAARELFRITTIRAKAGISPGFDAVQAESLLVQAQAGLAPVEAERARIIGSLVTLTAQPANAVIASLAKASPVSSVRASPAITPADMLRARPDIAAAEARLAAADADIAVAAAQRFPKLSLSGTLGLLAFALGDVFSADTVIGSLGAGIAGPLLDFGRIDAEIDGSKARAKEAFAGYRATVFTALGDAETAYGQAAAQRAEVATLEKQQRLEKDAVYLAGIRYKRGLNDFRTVLNAQRALYSVNREIDAARGRYERTRVALWLALGGS